MRLINSNGQSWIVGLEWCVPPLEASLADIKTYVENEQCDCIVKRGIQIGFGASEGNTDLLGKRSLAAWLSIPVNSFIGIFHLADELTDESFWWLFARINGNNMSGFGDAVFSDLKEVEQAREDLIDLLPPNTQIEQEVRCETEHESLAWLRPRCEVGLMAKLSGQYIVKPVSAFRGEKTDISKRLVIAAILMAMLGAGAYYGYEYLTYMGITSKAKERAADIQRRKMEIERNPEKIFDQKWQKYPYARPAAISCLKGVNSLSLNYAGWKLDDIECALGENSGNMTLKYIHTPMAAYRHIPDNATFGKGKGGKGGGKGNEIKQFATKQPLEWGFPQRKAPYFKELPKQDRIRRLFLEIAQGFGVKTVLSFSAPEKKSVPELGSFTCPWVKGSYTISGVNSTQVVGICDFLGGISSLTVTRIQYDLSSWVIKGEVYAL